MNVEDIRNHCLSLPGTTEGFPFGQQALVFKVMNKMYLLTRLDQVPLSFNAKCEPEAAVELREKYPAIRPGFHMNKTHWNTVACDGSLSTEMLKSLIDDSYRLVVAGLPASIRTHLHA